MQRQRSIPHTFEGNIAAEKASSRSKPRSFLTIPRDKLLHRIRQLDTASHMSGWLASPGLKRPD